MEPTLNQRLAALGLTTRPANRFFSAGCKDILRDGQIVFTGDAGEVWVFIGTLGC